MNRTPSRSAFDAYTELIDGAADEASRPVRVSIRYFANVAAWSELPRAQVTTARGAMLRTHLSELLDAGRDSHAAARRTAAGAAAASRNMRVSGVTDVLSSATKS